MRNNIVGECLIKIQAFHLSLYVILGRKFLRWNFQKLFFYTRVFCLLLKILRKEMFLVAHDGFCPEDPWVAILGWWMQGI